MEKTYLGDGVYVETHIFGLILTTENGYGASNTIFLEPQVYAALVAYVEALKTATPPRRLDPEGAPGDAAAENTPDEGA